METHELENEVYAALTGNAELLDVLPLREKAIFHYVAPSADPSRYPIIVYSTISDVPALAGDNKEVAHRVTIWIIVNKVDKKLDRGEKFRFKIIRGKKIDGRMRTRWIVKSVNIFKQGNL